MVFEETKKDKLSVGSEINIKAIKKKLIGSYNLKKGEKIYELDLDTGKISESVYGESTLKFSTKKTNNIRKQLMLKENCFYEKAINLKNAKRKFEKRLQALDDKFENKIIYIDCISCKSKGTIKVLFYKKDNLLVHDMFPCSCGATATTLK